MSRLRKIAIDDTQEIGVGDNYGKEVILDLHHCDVSKFNRKDIEEFFIEICNLIDMKRCALHWWDDVGVPKERQQTEPHLKGTSAVQFISTSDIVIHTLDLLENVYLNIFSCKDFNGDDVKNFAQQYFDGKIVSFHEILRR